MGLMLTHSQLLEGLKNESKYKTAKGGGVGARSLAHNTLRGRRACWSSGMGLRRVDKLYSLTRACTQPTQKWLVHSWSTFGARTRHEQHGHIRLTTARTWGEATTFPLIVYFSPLHRTYIQMVFFPGTPEWESQNRANRDSRNFGAP
jgi:hypothetical protein